MTCWRGAYEGRVSLPDVSEFSSLFPQPFENIRISAIDLHAPTVCLPLFFQLFFFVPSPIMAPKHHQSLVELEDKIEGFGVRPRSMTPPSDPHHSQPLSSDLPLRPPLEEPSPKPLTPPEQLKKLKRGIFFFFILTLIWLLSHAELLDTGFVDSENLSRNKN